MTNNLLLEAALSYAKNGWHIMPLRPLTKDAFLTGHPTSADQDQIKQWWGRQPNYNLGFPAKDNGLWLVDVDFKDVKSKEGRELIDKVVAEFPANAPRSVTANGGLHFYFRPGKIPFNGAKKDVCPGIQIRQSGYYVVAPPSIYLRTADKDGPDVAGTCGHYKWEVPLPLTKEEIPEWPELKSVPWEQKKGQLGGAVVKGGRHDQLRKRATYLRKAKGIGWEALVAELRVEAQKFVPPYSWENLEERKEIEDMATWAMTRIEPLSSQREKNRLEKVHKEIEYTEELFEKLSGKLLRFSDPYPGFYKVTCPETKVIEPLLLNWNDLSSPIIRTIAEIAEIKTVDEALKAKSIVQLSYKECDVNLKPFAWPGEPCYTFRRATGLPAQGSFPAWQEFVDRLSDPLAFQLFIASIFEDDTSRQYLYLYDKEGEGGKSSVIDTITEFLGPNLWSVVGKTSFQGDSSRFLLRSLYQKRLVVYPDCKNSQIGMSEFVRNITSGDPAYIEGKGMAAFMTKLRLKFIIASNFAPEISSAGGDTSRLIPIKVQQSAHRTDNWRKDLAEQILPFIYDCQQKYAIHCPNKGNIPLAVGTRELVQDVAGELEEEFQMIADDNFQFGEGLSLPQGDLHRIFHDNWRGNDARFQYRKFKDYLVRRRGISEKAVRTAQGVRARVYRGLALIGGVGSRTSQPIQEV